MQLQPRKWETFQHYKDRMPPWIKLHKELLDDRVFQRLPDASRALAPCLWLLASESKDGIFDGSVEEVAFRVRQSEEWVTKAIKPLISSGFFVVVKDDSGMLAQCQQLAVPETETETETETKTTLSGKPDVAEPGKKKSEKPNFGAEAREILSFLNEKAGRRYQANQQNLGFIAGRLKQGATVTECRQVIVKKCREWLGSQQELYLRPETLFNATKFSSYQGELVVNPADVPRETIGPERTLPAP